MGRILFLSAVAYLAYRYIGQSNKKHQGITAKAGNAELLPPEHTQTAAIAAAPAPKLLEPPSVAAEPPPRG